MRLGQGALSSGHWGHDKGRCDWDNGGDDAIGQRGAVIGTTGARRGAMRLGRGGAARGDAIGQGYIQLGQGEA